MPSAMIGLQNVFKAYLQKRKQFAEKPEFRTVIYRGVLLIENENDLNDLINFRYAFDQQEFDGVVATVATAETTALGKFRLLFNESFAKAIKMIFY